MFRGKLEENLISSAKKLNLGRHGRQRNEALHGPANLLTYCKSYWKCMDGFTKKKKNQSVRGTLVTLGNWRWFLKRPKCCKYLFSCWCLRLRAVTDNTWLQCVLSEYFFPFIFIFPQHIFIYVYKYIQLVFLFFFRFISKRSKDNIWVYL